MHIPPDDLFITILSVILTFITGLILRLVIKQNKKSDKRYEDRCKQDYLMLETIGANGHLSRLTAKKLNGEHINGEMEKAIDRQEKAEADLSKHITMISQDRR
jgi:hypothetical protein